MKKILSHVLAFLLGAGSVLLTGCGMFATTDPWIEIGKSLAGACAKCHAGTRLDASTAPKSSAVPGGADGLLNAPAPGRCPILEAHAAHGMQKPQ
jgi:hypothetical protein